MNILMRRFDGAQQGSKMRDERESRTLCEMMDALLRGDPLFALMMGTARLKAIEASLNPNAGGWGVARHLELAPTRDTGLLTQRDQERASRDHRDVMRTHHGGHLPGRRPGKGAGKG